MSTGQTQKNSVVNPAFLRPGASGVTILDGLIAAAVFSISVLLCYRALDNVSQRSRSMRAYKKINEVESFIQNRVWQIISGYTDRRSLNCNASFMDKDPDNKYFVQNWASMSSQGDYKWVHTGAILDSANKSAIASAEFNAASDRCEAGSLSDVTTAEQAFYGCLVFRGSATNRHSIFFNLGEGVTNNHAFAEVWVGFRNATNPFATGVTCQIFGDYRNRGMIGLMMYSIYYAERVPTQGGFRYIHKRQDRMLYAPRTF